MDSPSFNAARRVRIASRLAVAFLMLFSHAEGARTAGDDAPLSIRAMEPWSGVFGGKEREFNFEVSSKRKVEGRAWWRMIVDERAIARRETMLSIAPGEPAKISVRFELPAAREGIILPLDLAVGVEAGEDRANVEKRLWLFPDDPFALKKDWLKDLKITLFDPAGETSRRFTESKIPFESVRMVDRAAALDEGIFIVGEGVSWSKQRALPQLALDLAAKGVDVLILSPTDGSLPLSGGDADNMPALKSLVFHRSDIITTLDKRLDAVAWPPDGDLQASGLRVTAERGRVMARVAEGKEGWPWFECRFAKPPGRLIICCFPVVERWESGPTPRYLLACILERLGDADEVSADQTEQPATSILKGTE